MTNDQLIAKIRSPIEDRVTGIHGEMRAVAFYGDSTPRVMMAYNKPTTDGVIPEPEWLDLDRVGFLP